MLTELGTGVGHLKAGFLGFNKSGKTYTATTLAIGTRKLFKMDGPIAFFDTESGAEYVAPRVLAETGKPLIGVKSRTLDDLKTTAKECIEKGVSVLIADSMTHVWREVCDTYLTRLNASRKRNRQGELARLEFQHWSAIKGIWAEWTDLYLNLPLHIIICGRAGYEWDFEEDDEGRKQLLKTGIKMKTESEFGFEPSLLVQMERAQTMGPHGAKAFVHRATVLGDRFGILDAKTCDDPDFDFFLPHLELLTPGAHNLVDTEGESDMKPHTGNAGWIREKREREILCDTVKGEFIKNGLDGRKAEVQKARIKALETCFDTVSWTEVENMTSEYLRAGLDRLRAYLKTIKEPA